MNNKRFYPISEEVFTESIEPIIIKNYIWKGRPPKISHYNTFCAILYVLRTGIGEICPRVLASGTQFSGVLAVGLKMDCCGKF